MTQYKIVAFDMDGTLLDSQKAIHPKTIETLTLLQQQGVQVVLVTGRHHSAVYPYSQQLGLNSPAICCNGSYLYDFKSQSMLAGHPMATHDALALLKLIKELGLYTLLYLDDVILYQRLDESLQRNIEWAKTLPESSRPNMQQADDLTPFVLQAHAIWKFSVGSDDLEQLALFAQQAAQTLPLSCERSWFNRIDVAKLGNTKGNMLRDWVQSQNYTMSEVIAFGDNENDISMLQMAGLGIAMGNSDAQVQQSADRVVGDNNSLTIVETLTEYFPRLLGS